MPHYASRQHRLNAHEVGPVMETVALRLRELVDARVNMDLAETLFKVLYRFEECKVGRPSYPDPVTWDVIEFWLEARNDTLTEELLPIEILHQFKEADQ